MAAKKPKISIPNSAWFDIVPFLVHWRRVALYCDPPCTVVEEEAPHETFCSHSDILYVIKSESFLLAGRIHYVTDRKYSCRATKEKSDSKL